MPHHSLKLHFNNTQKESFCTWRGRRILAAAAQSIRLLLHSHINVSLYMCCLIYMTWEHCWLILLLFMHLMCCTDLRIQCNEAPTCEKLKERTNLEHQINISNRNLPPDPSCESDRDFESSTNSHTHRQHRREGGPNNISALLCLLGCSG